MLRHLTQILPTLGLLSLVSQLGMGQVVDLTVDADSRFVLTGTNQPLLGIEITSPSGSLIPATSSKPFTQLLSNTANNVAYGVLGSAIIVDGSITLDSGWNRTTVSDVSYRYGFHGMTSPVFPLLDPSAPIEATIDSSHRFVVRGNRQQQLDGITFSSPSGSLTAADSASPFTSLIQNTSNEVAFRSTGPVSLDGVLKLPAGYDPLVGGKDVSFTYNQTGIPAPTGPFQIGAYPVPPPLHMSMDDNLNLVLHGVGQHLAGVELSSPSGALLPAVGPGPFAQVVTSTPNKVQFAAAPTGLAINGAVTLPVRWNGNQLPDVEWQYQNRAGETSTAEDLFVPSTRRNVRVQLDEELFFNLRGSGQQIASIDLFSPRGGLLPSQTAAPFQSTTVATSNRVRYQAGDHVTVDGLVKLGAQWNKDVRAPAMSYQYREVGSESNSGPFLVRAEMIDEAVSNQPLLVEFTPSGPDVYNIALTGLADLTELEFHSDGGSLIRPERSAPFERSSHRGNGMIRFQSRAPVKLDGRLVTAAGFDASRDQDITYRYTSDGRAVGPLEVSSNRYPPKALDVSLSDDFHFVVNGHGQSLQALALKSTSGSLIPNPTAAPFQAITANDTQHIRYEGNVTVDGQVTLPAQWNRARGQRDVTYEYAFDGVDFSRPRGVSGFPPPPPTALVKVSIDDDDHFVVTGTGQELSDLELRSASRSLIPAEDAAPFESFRTNTSSRVSYTTSGQVKLDGSVTLGAKYDSDIGGRDVSFVQRRIGATLQFGRVQEYPEFRPVQLSLDKENRFVITGSGERLLGFQLTSPSGSLIPGDNNDPFDINLSNTPENITHGVLGAPAAVVLDGSVTLSSRWNPLGSPDVSYVYGLDRDKFVGPFHLFRTPPEDLDVVRVDLTPNYRWQLEGTGQKLEQFNLLSNGGGLLPASTSAPFQNLTTNSTESIEFTTNENVTIDGTIVLDAGWQRDLGLRDVRYWYREEGADTNAGPFVVPNDVYPPLPPGRRVGVEITPDRKFQISGTGHELRTFELTSPSGSLTPAQDLGPFQGLTENSPSQISFEAAEFVRLDGTLKLDAGYNVDVSGEDVSYRYRQVGFLNPRGPYSVSDRQYPPNPKKSPLRMRVDDDLNLLVGGIGQLLTSLQIDSPNGSLSAAEDPAPFANFATSLPTQVVVEAADTLRIEGFVKLPVSWTETAADISFTYSLDGVEDVFGPLRIDGRDYPAPNVINVTVNNSGSISLFGSGQEISGFQIKSASGSLHRLDVPDIEPFDTVVSSTANLVEYAATDPVSVRFLSLPFRWDPEGTPDLEISFLPTGSRAIAARIVYGTSIPEPSSFGLSSMAFLTVLIVRRRRQMVPA